MAVPDSSISPKILSSAKRAFLTNGYEKTNLKDICREAGVTTGALYKRFAGKEALFCALVEQAASEIEAIAEERERLDPRTLSDSELLNAWSMYGSSSLTSSMQEWFDFLYARKDEFTLIITCAGGTCYSHFIRDWVDAMTEGTYGYLSECIRRNMVTNIISRDELGILLSAFWTLISEPFIRNFNKQQLDIHCTMVCRMFDWYEILGLHLPT